MRIYLAILIFGVSLALIITMSTGLYWAVSFLFFLVDRQVVVTLNRMNPIFRGMHIQSIVNVLALRPGHARAFIWTVRLVSAYGLQRSLVAWPDWEQSLSIVVVVMVGVFIYGGSGIYDILSRLHRIDLIGGPFMDKPIKDRFIA